MKKLYIKKRIVFVIFFVCLSICSYVIIDVIERSNKIITTNALPITNKTVIIDAGHGSPDEGAIGFNGTTEAAINLEIALKLQKLVEQSGAKVILTRSDENGIYSNKPNSIRNLKISDIKNRVDIGNNSNADIFVSIHLNKNIEKKNNRKIMPISNIYIMDNVKIPAVIVECGFLSNPSECEELRTESYQNKIIWGIYLGLQEYFANEGEKNE